VAVSDVYTLPKILESAGKVWISITFFNSLMHLLELGVRFGVGDPSDFLVPQYYESIERDYNIAVI
jgi:hypothetical protein